MNAWDAEEDEHMQTIVFFLRWPTSLLSFVSASAKEDNQALNPTPNYEEKKENRQQISAKQKKIQNK
jgi:hypothetical protein